MSTIKFAVIGLGHIGNRHADMILQNTQAELVAIIDNNEKIGIEKYNVPFFNSINSFNESNIKADIICIATPNNLHCINAIESLKNQMRMFYLPI